MEEVGDGKLVTGNVLALGKDTLVADKTLGEEGLEDLDALGVGLAAVHLAEDELEREARGGGVKVGLLDGASLLEAGVSLEVVGRGDEVRAGLAGDV